MREEAADGLARRVLPRAEHADQVLFVDVDQVEV